MGAKTAYMQPTREVLDFVAGRAAYPDEVQVTDPGYRYARSYVFDVSWLSPRLAAPHSVDHVIPVEEMGAAAIHQGFIGSCTGGRRDDIGIAADLLRGKEIPRYCRLIVIPASAAVMRACMERGYIRDLIDAGATISTPGCGPCLGAHEGVLAPGEAAISSSNRNFPGRMGSTEARIYLASPATVAASVLKGRITDPRTIKRG